MFKAIIISLAAFATAASAEDAVPNVGQDTEVNILARPLISGPTFDCSKAKSPIALTICSNQYAALTDWELSSAYLALYFSKPDDASAEFRSNHHEWLDQLELRCLLQSQPSICIGDAYGSRARVYRSQLEGDALAEAYLSKDERIRIQARLTELGYYPNVRPDGLFGPMTREAIKKFQASIALPSSNFLSLDQRRSLFDAISRESSPALDSPSGWEVPIEEQKHVERDGSPMGGRTVSFGKCCPDGRSNLFYHQTPPEDRTGLDISAREPAPCRRVSRLLAVLAGASQFLCYRSNSAGGGYKIEPLRAC